MSVGMRIGERYWEVGSGSFLHAFFSTISYRLEPEGWGTRFPILMGELYEGTLSASSAREALKELSQARRELARFPPASVIWDIDNLHAAPPWGDNISEEITDLSNYFVTSDGKDLFEVLTEAFTYLRDTGGTLRIE